MTRPSDLPLRQRDYLLRIARAMSAELDPRVVLALVIRAAVAMTAGQAGAIAMRRAEGGPLEIVAGYRLDARMTQALRRLDGMAAGGAPAEAPAEPPPASSDEPAASPSTRTALVHVPAPEPAAGPGNIPEEPQQLLTLPLQHGQTLIGRIVVFRGEGAAVFTPLDEDLLNAFADQAAVAIQNALLHQRLATRERQLALVLGHAASGLMVLDAEGRILHANAAAERLLGTPRAGILGQVAATVIGLETDAGVGIALPLPDRPDATASARGRLRVAGWDAPGPWVQVALSALGGNAGGDGSAPAIDGFVADITDLTAWREAEHAKTAFLGGLSHELKTPLSLIRGFAETLAAPGMADDEAFVAQATGVILDETARLTSMVDALLEAARLEGGGLRLAIDEVDVGALLERLTADFRAAHPDREWRLDVASSLPLIAGDAERLRDVFAELLANAGKYAEPGTPVSVTARAADGGQAVEVRTSDQGAGIASRDLPHLFERFYRSPEHAGDRAGTGLGLYAVKAVVEAHGGTIGVGSTPGSGSTFTVRLPRMARLGATKRLAAPRAAGGPTA